MSTDHLWDARKFSEKAHQGQTRWSGEPYANHPKRVVDIITYLGFDGKSEILEAAYLHDVLEDTKIPESEIRDRFGSQVLSLVKELTHNAKSTEEYLEYVEKLSYDAKIIKMADIIDNLSGYDKKSPHFVDKRMKALNVILKELFKH